MVAKQFTPNISIPTRRYPDTTFKFALYLGHLRDCLILIDFEEEL